MLLINKLEESDKPKIINVSSFAHKKYNLNLNDLENKNNYNSVRAYYQSKLLNIFFRSTNKLDIFKFFGNNQDFTILIFSKVKMLDILLR